MAYAMRRRSHYKRMLLLLGSKAVKYATDKKSDNFHGELWSGEHRRKCSRILPYFPLLLVLVWYM